MAFVLQVNRFLIYCLGQTVKKNASLYTDNRRSNCAVACSLDLLGDRWTLLVVRDLFLGKTRFHQFLGSPEGITTNVLSDRLKCLEATGLILRAFYQDHPPRAEYYLTDKGRTLERILEAFSEWGHEHIPGTTGTCTKRRWNASRNRSSPEVSGRR
jgi:DNA-binding HxlR family transcriptional regulator